MSGAVPLTDSDWAVRSSVYRSFTLRLRAPSPTEIAAELGTGEDLVRAALDRLELTHQLALLPDRSGIWMANPFSAVPTDFPVRTAAGTCWANCAWDALGVPAILGADAWIEARCANSGTPIVFGVEGGRRTGDDGIVHLVVPPRDAWEDIGFT